MPRRLRFLSLPTAALGVVAFFLPWVHVSCGSIKGRLSGYDFATGAWEEKIGAARARRLKERLRVDDIRRTFSKDRPGDTGQTILHPEQPLLWIIPAGMVVVAVLIVAGLPRVVPLLAAGVVAAALGYFKYRFELEVSNARVPGQIALDWLDGYWANWLALVLLLLLLLVPRRRA